jgi:hypothetical protein
MPFGDFGVVLVVEHGHGLRQDFAVAAAALTQVAHVGVEHEQDTPQVLSSRFVVTEDPA